MNIILTVMFVLNIVLNIKVKNNGLEKSDLIQEGMIGLNHAIDRYQEKEDTLFYTYAKKCIERKILSVVICAGKDVEKWEPSNIADGI